MAFLKPHFWSLLFLIQSGIGQLSIYNHERPIVEVLKDPHVSEHVKMRLQWVGEIKLFVEQTIGMKPTSNYTTYVDLKRPYVIWSITVAEPYALKLKEWRFPIVGAFPYLGFFEEKKAREELEDYQKQGLDTSIRGVSAYSTLGYLRDPLLSSMLHGKKADMANLIFHETTHSEIFIKNEGSFNEEAASFVGDYGEKLWIEKAYGAQSAEMKAWHDERADRRRFGIILREFAAELKDFYTSSETLAVELRSEKKRKLFAVLQDRLKKEPWLGRGFKKASEEIDNNAILLGYLTYDDDQEVFDSLYEKCGHDLKRSVEWLRDFTQTESVTPQSVLKSKLLEPGFSCANDNV